MRQSVANYMNISEKTLWNRIQNFRFDEQETAFTFSDRVARENGWPKHYSLRVIEEYKRFIFICCISNNGVTPSDPVDQVWHLHLTFTKSYWKDFCQNTLQKEIHHTPTKGGKREAEKFNDYYTHLKETYTQIFEENPPADIWQPNKVRFSDIHFQRVNLKKYWLIKKPGKYLKSQLLLVCLFIISMFSIQATGDIMIGIFLTLVITVITTVSIIKRSPIDTNLSDRNKNNEHGSGGCSVDSGDNNNCHDGHSGCNSGSDGCSGSGCSGCGGGCGD